MLIKIGTRGSKLALVQTNYVCDTLKKAFPEHQYEIVVIKTTGDMDLTKPLDQIGSKGLFVDEIEKALLNNEIQLAVHSMKDMPAKPSEGLVFAKSWLREDPRDVLILKCCHKLSDLPIGSNIATGSKRRSYQLLKLRPDLHIFPIRGNIDTRIRKLHEGLEDGTQLDGIVLAAAGIHRLNINTDTCYYFTPDEMIPAPAQGTLGIELNANNHELLEMVNALSDEDAEKVTFLERSFLDRIGGDCHLPIGAYAYKENGNFVLKTVFGNATGEKLAFSEVSGAKAEIDLIEKAVIDIRRQLEDL